jgi:hypothetical protein
MRVIDIVKPEPKTELEAWERWLNRTQSSMMVLYKDRKVIEVKYIDTLALTSATRNLCAAYGHHQCVCEAY